MPVSAIVNIQKCVQREPEQREHRDLEHAVVADEDRPRLVGLRGAARVARRPAGGRACRAGSRARGARGRSAAPAGPAPGPRAGDSPPGAHASHGRRRQRAEDLRPAPRDLVLVDALPLALPDLEEPGIGAQRDGDGDRSPGRRRPRARSRRRPPGRSRAVRDSGEWTISSGRPLGHRQDRRRVRPGEALAARARPGAGRSRRAASRPGPGSGARRSTPTRRGGAGRASRRGPRG